MMRRFSDDLPYLVFLGWGLREIQLTAALSCLEITSFGRKKGFGFVSFNLYTVKG